MPDATDWIRKYGLDSASVVQETLEKNAQVLAKIADEMVNSLKIGGKTLFFGNGGSAADAQHLAAEFVNRYMLNRDELAGLALTTDTSVITSIANDFGLNQLFSKQVRALAKKGDIAVGMSTSGASQNVILGLDAAKEIGCINVGLCGNKPETMEEVCDFVLPVDCPDTPMIQQAHITMGHALCYLVEQQLFGDNGS